MRNETSNTFATFKAAGYTAFPLRRGTKMPAHRGWQRCDYSEFDPMDWIAKGGNVGLRLAPGDLVLDLDPRNTAPGDAPLARLSADIGADLADAPTVITGSGGRHFYWAVPDGIRIRAKLDGYKGIDFKTHGGFVVAPGSRHPDTGRTYRIDPHAPPIALVDYAPEGLLDLLRKPDAPDRREGAGILEQDQLAMLLDALHPSEYGQGEYAKWIVLAAACHDATGGAGLAEFTAWCMGDEDYCHAEAIESVERHWNSFKAGKRGGVTYRTLFRAVADAGRGDLVAKINASLMLDFDDDVSPNPLDFGDDGTSPPALDFDNDDEGRADG